MYATAATRIPRDVRGQTLPVKLTVIDRRPSLSNRTDLSLRASVLSRGRGPYKISVLLQVWGCAVRCSARTSAGQSEGAGAVWVCWLGKGRGRQARARARGDWADGTGHERWGFKHCVGRGVAGGVGCVIRSGRWMEGRP